MSQEHPSCQVLWWEESSVSTRVRVPAIPCAWFYYSSGILCSRIWLSPPLDWGTCEDNVLLMFNPHSLVCCLPDKCHLDEWMEVSYKLTLSSTLTTSPQLGHLSFSTLSMNHVIFSSFASALSLPLIPLYAQHMLSSWPCLEFWKFKVEAGNPLTYTHKTSQPVCSCACTWPLLWTMPSRFALKPMDHSLESPGKL